MTDRRRREGRRGQRRTSRCDRPAVAAAPQGLESDPQEPLAGTLPYESGAPLALPAAHLQSPAARPSVTSAGRSQRRSAGSTAWSLPRDERRPSLETCGCTGSGASAPPVAPRMRQTEMRGQEGARNRRRRSCQWRLWRSRDAYEWESMPCLGSSGRLSALRRAELCATVRPQRLVLVVEWGAW